ncbi:MAG: hypothetical protein JWO96_157 [Candidatus Saccharibacteria bacterium]|nr:hypothetical protein [Candidatus Saccharibacteria bacterium]
MKRVAQGGFTLVEVSIASTIFSVVLLVALTSFFTIGRLFYKGVSITQTQEAASQVLQDINGNFQAAGNVSPAQSGNGYNYYCIGNSRYTYNVNHMVNIDDVNHASPASGGTFGILKDTLPGSSACAVPCNDDPSAGTCAAGTVKLNNPVELLGHKMRVEKFDVTSSASSSNLYNISLVIAYGDDSVLTYSTTPPDYSGVSCVSDPRAQQFCSISRIDTAVYRGLSY